MQDTKAEKELRGKMSTGTSREYSWADLPKELLEMIGRRLKTRIDVFRFRAICTSWRSVVPLSFRQSSHRPPLQLPPPINATIFMSPVTICRIEDETRNSCCLIRVIESTSGEMQLLNPLLKISPHKVSKTLNMLNFRLVELGKGCRLNIEQKFSTFGPKKVVSFGQCGILTIFDVGKLGYWSFSDESWTSLGNEETHFDDIVVYKGQFYVVDSLGIISWVQNDPINLVQYSPPLCGFGHVKNLVVSDGDLFVVDSYLDDMEMSRPKYYETVDMKVYKLDEEWGTWVEVKSLGDRVFVLGKEVCFSASVKDFPECKGNCIYFIDRKANKFARAEFKHYNARVFEVDDRSFKSVECFPSHMRLFSPSMIFSFTSPFPSR